MSEIADFINAQYDRLEAVALAAKGDTPGRWENKDDPATWIVLVDKSGKLTMGQHRHIALHDPAYVLADVESKRETLKLHYVVGFEDEDGHDIGRGCAECGYSAEHSDRGGWCETVRLLAAPFSGEPGYNEDWAV